MADSTCLNCLRIIVSQYKRKFCDDNCYLHHTYLTNEVKKYKKRAIDEQKNWKTKIPNLHTMFYEAFWKDKICNICGSPLENQLHIKLRNETGNINSDSFQILCSRCYLKINNS